MKQGLPPEIARLHAQTFHQIQYQIKHKLGIGPVSHSHNNPKPVHGVGQGSTDAPARWGFVCDSLLELYKRIASDAIICSPVSPKTTNNKIAGFVDDTTTLTIQHYSIMLYIIIILQRDTQTWEKLLHASGGKLEIPKCIFALFEWTFDNWGRATLSKTTQNHIHLTSSETNQLETIPQMSTADSYKYVGVQLALDGNMDAQTKDLQKKCHDISSILTQNYFNAIDANQGYTTVFAPSVKYVLPVTSICPSKLSNIQKISVSSILPRIGFNKHMPRSVVFASKSRGGIGVLNLPTEQGVSQIQLIITHLRAKSYLYNTILILMESFQLVTGIPTSPFLHTKQVTYVQSPWIQSVQKFLNAINGKIYIPDLTPITINRINDKPIMQSDLNLFTKSEMESINACRLFLQVTYLSDISNDNGTSILQEAVKGICNSKGQPKLWNISRSKLTWPRQPRPSTAAWNKWKTYLQAITSPTFRINPPLGHWTSTAHDQRTWHYTRYINLIYNTSSTRIISFVEQSSRTRNRHFSLDPLHDPVQWNTSFIPVVPHFITDTKISCHSTQTTMVEHRPTNTLPSLTYKVQYCREHHPDSHQQQIQSLSNISIVYKVNSTNRKTTTTALISLDNEPYATTSFMVPNHRHNTNLSFQAYGCVIPLLFCSTILPKSTQECDIILFCNTKQIYTKLHQTQCTHTTSPTHCYSPEWDLLSTITRITKRFKTNKILDTTKRHPNYDQQHSWLQEIENQILEDKWQQMSSTYDTPQLTICNQRVPSDYTSAIRDAHTAPEIDEYYSSKYKWDHQTINQIMWNQHGKALTSLPKRMGKTIIQFNHEWLPVNTSYSTNATGTGRLCPFCSTCEEDQNHFLQCNHPTLTDQWANAGRNIKTKLTTYDKEIHHHLILLLSLAVTDWRTNPVPTTPTFLAPQFHQLFQSQSKIGWNHILKGRFSKQWRHHMRPDRERALQWVTFAIKTIWYQVYSVWKTRCQIQHGTTADEKTKRALLYLTPKVHDLYNQSSTLQHTEQYMFETPVENILLQPIGTIKTWIHKVTLRIKNIRTQAKAKRRREKAKVTRVHPFFEKTHTRTDKKKAKLKPKDSTPKVKFTATTLTKFFPQLRKHQPPPSQNDLFPP
jgi:hypothetical protein